MTVSTLWKEETVSSWDVCSTIFREEAEYFLPVMAMAMVTATVMAMAMDATENMGVMENIIHIIEEKPRNRAKRIVKI